GPENGRERRCATTPPGMRGVRSRGDLREASMNRFRQELPQEGSLRIGGLRGIARVGLGKRRRRGAEREAITRSGRERKLRGAKRRGAASVLLISLKQRLDW